MISIRRFHGSLSSFTYHEINLYYKLSYSLKLFVFFAYVTNFYDVYQCISFSLRRVDETVKNVKRFCIYDEFE